MVERCACAQISHLMQPWPAACPLRKHPMSALDGARAIGALSVSELPHHGMIAFRTVRSWRSACFRSASSNFEAPKGTRE